GDTSGEEVPHVALVLMGARGAAGGPPVAATDVENADREVAAVERLEVLAGPAIEGACLTEEAYRAGTEPWRSGLLGPVLEVVGEDPSQRSVVLEVEGVEIGVVNDAVP